MANEAMSADSFKKNFIESYVGNVQELDTEEKKQNFRDRSLSITDNRPVLKILCEVFLLEEVIPKVVLIFSWNWMS